MSGDSRISGVAPSERSDSEFERVGMNAMAAGPRSSRLRSLLEILAIGLWACWVGRAYLDFDPYTWPLGRELGYQIEGHFFWNQLKSCGLCALWDGGVNGGAPALVDLFSPKLHPFVAVPTLIWGVAIGTKISIVLSLWMAGIAQWWLARILKLSLIPRLWSAALVIVGGNLLGRLALGAPGLVLSTAASSLALVAAINLALGGRRSSTILLAVLGGLAIISGHGYLQLGLVGWAPALLFLGIGSWPRFRRVSKEFALAICLSLLLAAIAIAPAVHFFPNFMKFVDPNFQSSQPLEYIPLNLVIRDHGFFRSEALGKSAFEDLYTLYVGWVPILLALLSLRFASRRDSPILLCLASGVLLMFFLASGIPLRWVVHLVPSLSGFRHTPLIAGMAVPGVLGLAAYGLDRVLVLKWPDVSLRLSSTASGKTISFSLAWIMVIPLLWSLLSAYGFGKEFLGTVYIEPLYTEVNALKTPDLEWVSTPFGEHFWVEPAIERGIKLTAVVSVWWWKGRQSPAPSLVATRDQAPADGVQVGSLEPEIPIYQTTARPYAYVAAATSVIPCTAQGTGGDITVECTADEKGTLIVEENAWNGWRAYLDDQPVELLEGPLLSTVSEPGKHVYRFSYRPWDAVIGLLITIAGIGVTLALALNAEIGTHRGITDS